MQLKILNILINDHHILEQKTETQELRKQYSIPFSPVAREWYPVLEDDDPYTNITKT